VALICSWGLTALERQQWREDGYFIRQLQFDDAALAPLREAADRIASMVAAQAVTGSAYELDGKRFVDIEHITLQYEHQADSQQLRVVEPVHELDDQLLSLMADPRLIEPMRALVGSDRISVWTAKLNFKQAFVGSGFGWHQDSPYWIHASNVVDQLPNVFVALDSAGAANGGLRLIRGSHKRGVLPGLADGSQLEGFYTHPDEIDNASIVAPDLPAGSLLFFSPHIIHGSNPNSSAQQRRALIATYQPAGQPELKSGRLGRVY